MPDLTPERLHKYVERRFQESGRTEWPTVRECARSLKVKQANVGNIAEEHEAFCLSCYQVDFRVPCGDWFVETLNDLPPDGI